ncbi:hypothetical protein [Nocardioides sp. SR21]|uniref:hypothetical protein n=1 Tax=Nocardioides sp. SR21 TaxID=2919501 RepID=UPI001FA95CE7|nr:hypothetical protein [Nocardioides sp. SR21]
MRIGTLTVLAATFTVALQGVAVAAPAPPHDRDVAIKRVQAIASDSVVDTYGVGIHTNFLDTPYRDADAVAAAVKDLGVRHVRDDLYLDAPRQYAAIRTVAAAGARFDLILGRPDGSATPTDYVETVARLAPGAVESIEGVNEWDLKGGDGWVPEMVGWQRGIWDAARANPATADLPVLSPALAFRWNYAQVSDLSPYAHFANAHMYPGGYRPTTEIARILQALLGTVPDRPVITTEAGYHNAVNASSSHPAVPEDVAGAYLPRLLLEHVAAGDHRMYSYELIDSFDDPDLDNPEAHFGLLRHDLSPKPAYVAMKRLLHRLADPGPAFDPGSLAFRVDGLPADARTLLTQRRNGRFVLLLWRDVTLYDPARKVYRPATASDVTLQLARRARMTVHRPSEPGFSRSATRGRTLPLALDGHVTAVTIVPRHPIPPR